MHRKRNRAIPKLVMNILCLLMIISGRGCMHIMQSEHNIIIITIIMMSMTL